MSENKKETKNQDMIESRIIAVGNMPQWQQRLAFVL